MFTFLFTGNKLFDSFISLIIHPEERTNTNPETSVSYQEWRRLITQKLLYKITTMVKAFSHTNCLMSGFRRRVLEVLANLGCYYVSIRVFLDSLTLENGISKLSRNVGNY
jgi:hypothetical protein